MTFDEINNAYEEIREEISSQGIQSDADEHAETCVELMDRHGEEVRALKASLGDSDDEVQQWTTLDRWIHGR